MKISQQILVSIACFILLSCKPPSPKNSNADRLPNHKAAESKKSSSKTVVHIYSKDSLLNATKESCRLDSIDGYYIPKNLKDAHLALDGMLDDSSKVHLTNGAESHFGLGMQLRNKWGLWTGSRLKCYFEQKGLKHPDHMSEMILTTYSLKLNNHRINEDSIINEAINALKEWNKKMEN